MQVPGSQLGTRPEERDVVGCAPDGISGSTPCGSAGHRRTHHGLRRYVDAGATEIYLTQTDLGTAQERRRTWDLLAELRRG